MEFKFDKKKTKVTRYKVTGYNDDSDVSVAIYDTIKSGTQIDSLIREAEKLSNKAAMVNNSWEDNGGNYSYSIRSVGVVLVTSAIKEEPEELARKIAHAQMILFLKILMKLYLKKVVSKIHNDNMILKMEMPIGVYKSL